MITTEDSTEKCISGKQQWTVVDGELFRLKHPAGEGSWPGAILEKGQMNLDLRVNARSI